MFAEYEALKHRMLLLYKGLLYNILHVKPFFLISKNIYIN
jgi:hypothetical protein